MRYIEWHITNNCNLFCKHCMVNASAKKEDLSQEDIDKIINVIIELSPDIVNITGGEPFLSKYLFYISRRLSEQQINLTVSTNATVSIDEEELDQLLTWYEGGMQVSLDSPIEILHDSIRGKVGAYKAVLDLIQRINRKNPTYSIQLCMCVRKDNFETIDLFTSVLQDLKIDNIKFLRLMQLGRARQELEINSAELELALSKISKLQQENRNVHVFYSDPVRNMRTMLKKNNRNFDLFDINYAGNVYITSYLRPCLGNILLGDKAHTILKRQKDVIKTLCEDDILDGNS